MRAAWYSTSATITSFFRRFSRKQERPPITITPIAGWVRHPRYPGPGLVALRRCFPVAAAASVRIPLLRGGLMH